MTRAPASAPPGSKLPRPKRPEGPSAGWRTAAGASCAVEARRLTAEHGTGGPIGPGIMGRSAGGKVTAKLRSGKRHVIIEGQIPEPQAAAHHIASGGTGSPAWPGATAVDSPAVGLPSSKVAKIAIEPPTVTMTDITPGIPKTVTVRVHNFSTEIQRVSLQPPRSGFYKLRQRKLDDIPIAPGLDLPLDVEFLVPHNFFKAKQTELQRFQQRAPADAVGGPENGDPAALIGSIVPFGSAVDPQANRNDPSEMRFVDKLIIDVHGQRSMVVHLDAHPEDPQLAFPSKLDFGVLLMRWRPRPQKSPFGHHQVGTQVEGDAESVGDQNPAPRVAAPAADRNAPAEKEQVQDGSSPQQERLAVRDDRRNSQAFGLLSPPKMDCYLPLRAVKHMTIRNVGKRKAKLRLVYDRSLPLRLSPSSITLGPENGRNIQGLPTSSDVDVQLSPAALGKFEATVYLEVEDTVPVATRNCPGWSTKVNTPERTSADLLARHDLSSTVSKSFVITAQVLEQKLVLLAANGDLELDPSSLYFGSIYYSQTSTFSARLFNSGPANVRWVITHAGESEPVTSCANRLQSREDEENKTAISVYPSEGHLRPYETTSVAFTFAPRVRPPLRGFRCLQTVHPPHLYQVPMQLKSIDVLGRPGETPEIQDERAAVNLNLCGKAWPLHVEVTKLSFNFPKGDSLPQPFEVRNHSPQLPIDWAVSTAAHFKVVPASGTLLPKTSVECQMVFKPNNFGTFRVTLHLNTYSRGQNGMKECVKLVPLKVVGSCMPSHICGVSSVIAPTTASPISADRRTCAGEADLLPPASCPSGRASTANEEDLRASHAVTAKTPHYVAEKCSTAFGGRRSSDLHADRDFGFTVTVGETKFNPVRQSHDIHRRRYDRYIAQSRQGRMHRELTRKFGEDAMALVNFDVTSSNLLGMEDLAVMDPENGLTPPDIVSLSGTAGRRRKRSPMKNSKSQRAQSPTQPRAAGRPSPTASPPSTAVIVQVDDRKKRQLFEKLVESSTPGKPRLHPPSSTSIVPPPGFMDEPLTAENLASIYTAFSTIDFGQLTAHTVSERPLNFLNGTPSAIVHITLQVTDYGDSKQGTAETSDGGVPPADCAEVSQAICKAQLRLTPEQVYIPPMTVCGVELSLQSHTPGVFHWKIVYLVNGRYKYRIPVSVNVIPVNLTLNVEEVELEATIDALRTADGTLAAPTAKYTLQLTNPGNYHACFRWRTPAEPAEDKEGKIHVDDPQGKREQGMFQVNPVAGIVEPQQTVALIVSYLPGLSPTLCETLQMDIIDDTNERGARSGGDIQSGPRSSERIVKTLSLPCRGDIQPTRCILLTNAVTSSKRQIPVDLGVLAVSDPPSPLDSVSMMATPTAALMLHPGGLQAQANSDTTSGSAGGFQLIKIKNVGSNPAFAMMKSTNFVHHSKLQIDPPQAVIGSGEVLDIKVSVIALGPGTACTETVQINVIGSGKPIRVPVKYEARLPEVEVSTSKCDMSQTGTILGSWSSVPLRLANKGTVPARVILDLRDHPAFELTLDDNTSDPWAAAMAMAAAGDHQAFSNTRRTCVLHVISNEHPAYKWQRWRSALPANAASVTDSQGQPAPAAAAKDGGVNISTQQLVPKSTLNVSGIPTARENPVEGKMYLLDMQPTGETITLVLTYRPVVIRTHKFDLPIKLVGHAGRFWNIPVLAESVPSPLLFSRRSVVFKSKVVYKDIGTMGVHLAGALRETVSLTNNCNKTLKYWLDTEDAVDDNVFRFEPQRGTLAPNESAHVTITFNTETVGQFKATVPVHMDLVGTAPFVLEVYGAGVEPSLTFSPNELHLPIVPLGVESSAASSITNHGCERSEVRYSIPEDVEKLGVSIAFPEGKLLKADGEKLTVIVKFTAAMTTSFMSRIELRDSSGRVFYLPIRGTADNSFLTLFAYRHWTRTTHEFRIPEPNGPVQYEKTVLAASVDEKSKRARVIVENRVFRSPGGVPLEDERAEPLEFFRSVGETALRWLEDRSNISTTAIAFPQNLIASHGKGIHDIVVAVSGRKAPTVAHSQLLSAQSMDELAWLLYRRHASLLNQLVSVGALLSNVDPEHLLSFDHYLRVSRSRAATISQNGQRAEPASAALSSPVLDYQQKTEAHFATISAEAWATVLLQIIRVYVVSPFTIHHFRTLRGVDKAQEASLPVQLADSNFYSVPDSILLKWVAYHAFRETGVFRRIANFEREFADGVLFAYLIASHVPSIGETRFRNFNVAPETNEAQESNAKMVVSALVELFGNMEIRPTTITKGSALEIYLLCCFLYQSLPQCIPQETIEFKGRAQEKVRRQIEICNANSRPVSYVVKLDGPPEFSVKDMNKNATIVLAPKSTLSLAVEMVGRFSNAKKLTAQLKTRSKRLSFNNVSVMAFDLVGIVEKAPPRRFFRVEGHVIPPSAGAAAGTTVEVAVTNPFRVAGRFSVRLSQAKKPGAAAASGGNVAGPPQTGILLDRDGKNVISSEALLSPPAFRVAVSEVILAAEGSGSVAVTFAPCEIGVYECTLTFIDNHVGEFACAIEGHATAPQQQQPHTDNTNCDH